MVKETSKFAYDEHRKNGKAVSQRMRIYEYIKQAKQPLTRKQIEIGMDIEINAVCGRVNELLRYGVIEVAFRDKCPITRKKVEFLKVKGNKSDRKVC